MKTPLPIAILFVLLVSKMYGQQTTFEWAFGVGNTGIDRSNEIAYDSFGNIYISGFFENSIDMDHGPGEHWLTATGIEDNFIAKYNPVGDLLWARSLGATTTSYADVNQSELAVDQSGNVFVAGLINGTTDIDPGPGEIIAENIDLSLDAYIIKLDTDGNTIWAKSLSTVSAVVPCAMAIDNNGQPVIAGHYVGVTDFDPGLPNTATTSVGADDIFLLKLDVDGNYLWLQTLGSDLSEQVSDLVLDPADNIFITGTFNDTLDFDPGTGESLKTPQDIDGYILKLTESGSFGWVRTIEGEFSQQLSDIALDADQNIVCSGYYIGASDFDPGPLVYEMSSITGLSACVFKLTNNGDFLWAKKIEGPFDYGSTVITSDAWNNVYISGCFGGLVDFDPGDAVYYLNTGSFFTDIFLLILNKEGDFVEAQNIGTMGYDGAADIAVMPSGHCLVTGDFGSGAGGDTPADFNAGTGADYHSSNGQGDVFVLKLRKCATESVDVQYAENSFTWIDGQTYYASNNTATFTLTNVNGCDSLIFLDLTITNLGFEESTFNNLVIYPNPANDKIQVELADEGILEVYNQAGTLVSSEVVTQGVQSMAVDNLSSGGYLLVFRSNSACFRARFVVN